MTNDDVQGKKADVNGLYPKSIDQIGFLYRSDDV